jgi:Flp pilus assembly protein TadB
VNTHTAEMLLCIAGLALFVVVLYIALAFNAWRDDRRRMAHRLAEQRERAEKRRAQAAARKERKGPR